MNKLNFVDPNARPEDVQGEYGVSEKFGGTEMNEEDIKDIQESLNENAEVEYVFEGPISDPKLGNETMINLSEIVPAPKEWNFFDPIGKEKMTLLIKSIYSNGLFSPVTLWQQEDGKYMILAGHNRCDAYKALLQITKNDRYNSIPAKIYTHNDIDEIEARRIIIVSNIAQRAKESAKMTIKSIIELTKLEKQRAFYGSGVDVNKVIAGKMGLSETKVLFYRRLQSLNETLLDKFAAGEISRQAAHVFAGLSEDIQNYIVAEEKYKNIPPANLKLLKKAETVDEARKALEKEVKTKARNEYAVVMPFRRPKSCTTLALFVPKEEEDIVKEILRDAIKSDSRVSDHTRELVENIFKNG